MAGIGQEGIVRIHLYLEREQALAAIEGWRRGEEGGGRRLRT
jgi:hypothetical protein